MADIGENYSDGVHCPWLFDDNNIDYTEYIKDFFVKVGEFAERC